MPTAHVAGGGVASDVLYLAIPLLLVGVMMIGESRKWAAVLISVALVLAVVAVVDIVRAR